MNGIVAVPGADRALQPPFGVSCLPVSEHLISAKPQSRKTTCGEESLTFCRCRGSRRRRPGPMRRWRGRLRPFDQEANAQGFRDAVGVVPDRVRLLLDLPPDGVKLSPGGRLSRVVVRAVREHRPGWYPLGRAASIEEDLYPLATLHDILLPVRLLRLHNGVLSPPRPPGDENETVRRLRSWFALKQFSTMITKRIVGVLDAHGPYRSRSSPPKSSAYGSGLAARRPSDHRPRRRARAPPPVRPDSKHSTSSPGTCQRGLSGRRRDRFSRSDPARRLGVNDTAPTSRRRLAAPP